ncbi:hypothetical protein IV203_037124 [Nitzschia inconspicua]|uniref:Uncharacterized protein n=1 Tax=Nitzschia inconspicua TaxID=303405 RepID=A0A9K3LKU0_9STRA|nr:hypothetical protein IV203_037124 [Nitzschia inconspicua]
MNAKYFSYPWRSDNFSRHLKQQHPVKWDEYTSMPAEEKQKFFVEKESAAVVNMQSFVQPEGSMKARINAKKKLQFIIDADITAVCAERDNRNNSGDHLPHVLPLELCGVLLRDFVSCLEDQRIRLGHKFSEAEVENIDEQFRKLRLAFKEHSGFSQMLLDAQASRAVQSFEKCWSQLGSEFEQLSMFCGAIASIMPSTSSVESDFSLINWTKDSNSQSLSDFSLESILHCKQYKKLRDLME